MRIVLHIAQRDRPPLLIPIAVPAATLLDRHVLHQGVQHPRATQVKKAVAHFTEEFDPAFPGNGAQHIRLRHSRGGSQSCPGPDRIQIGKCSAQVALLRPGFRTD